MEYIREILRQQEEVLLQLLLGRRAAADKQEEQRLEHPGAEESGGGLSEEENGGAALAGKLGRPTPLRREGLRPALRRKSAERRTAMAIRVRGGDVEQAGVPGAGGDTGGKTGRTLRKRTFESPGEIQNALEPRGSSASGATAQVSAQTLSRTFQRDARRYDGAFRLY